MFSFAFLYVFYIFCSLQVFVIFFLSPSPSLLIAQLILCLFDLQFGEKKQKKFTKSSHLYINFSLLCYS